MHYKLRFLVIIVTLLVSSAFIERKNSTEDSILSYTVEPKLQQLDFYWKDNNQVIGSLENLKKVVEGQNKKLVFAMNGGMYKQDNSPQGLFIQNNKTITPLDTAKGSGNFYMKPNGVFYLTTDNTPVICTTQEFVNNGKVKYATQSGPMLVIDGKIHPSFKYGSANLNIRNGVGILPDNKLVFAMSKTEINFYDFANYFKNLGCRNALYLDGFVSRTYLPEKKWIQTDGNFGVIIAVTEDKQKE
ncbi:MAG: phosphodiester glycosidase family protein [Bacteroidia bacterium]